MQDDGGHTALMLPLSTGGLHGDGQALLLANQGGIDDNMNAMMVATPP